jgi:hypothetical protein
MGCKKVVASKTIFLLASVLRKSWWVLANCDVRGLDMILNQSIYH